MEHTSFDSAQKTGTIGGTLLVLLVNTSSGDLLKVTIQAAVGAAVSFFVSWLLNLWMRRRKKKQKIKSQN